MPPADADLHPVATGLAKDTVDRHSEKQQLKLYAGWFCPFVQRVWLALEEKGIPYQYVEVNPYHKGPDLIKANPRGLVPTLEVTPGKSLYESTVLVEYLEDAYPEHAPRLLPRDDFERARARIWTDFVTSRIIPAFHRFLQFQPGQFEDGEARLHKLRTEYRGKLLEFSRDLDPEGPYFQGKELGIVDLVLVPWATRHWVFDHFKGGLGIPEPGQGGQDEDTWRRWRKWVQAAGNRDSVKKTTSDQEHYIPIYKRYADDIAQSELAKATRNGSGVP